jgi:hypothetical protein
MEDKKMRATNIEWDLSDWEEGGEFEGEELPNLPTEMEIPDDLIGDDDAISDYISDETGFCHFGYDSEFNYTSVYNDFIIETDRLEKDAIAVVSDINGHEDIGKIVDIIYRSADPEKYDDILYRDEMFESSESYDYSGEFIADNDCAYEFVIVEEELS